MPFTDRLKDLLDDDKESPYHRKTNNESGPSGPLRINEARDWEITWENGRAVLLQTPRVPRPKGEDMPETPNRRPNHTRDRGGANTGILPSDPNAPLDKLNYVNKDHKITEEKVTVSYIERLAAVLALTTPLTFQDVLKIVKALYPDLKMQFPHPPTFIWNPKKEDSKGKEEGEEGEEGEEEDEEEIDDKAKLEPQKIKDTLKVKLPQLKWTTRMSDGVEEAELGFDDESTALFEIGAKANHLTLTYFEPPKGTEIKYDDSDAEDSDTTSP